MISSITNLFRCYIIFIFIFSSGQSPFETFPKIHPFLESKASLTEELRMLVSGPSLEHVDNIVEDFSYFGNMSTIFLRHFLMYNISLD